MKDTTSAAPGEDRSIALALVNTRRREARAIADQIATPATLSDWLQTRSAARIDRPIGAAELQRIQALRDAIRALLQAAATGTEPPAGSLRLVNQVSADAPRALALEWPAGGTPARGQVISAPGPFDQAIGEIATDAIELLTDARRSELVACMGPGCVRFLLKDHPRRHWCSPRCGERARAARYYQRHRVG